MNKILVAYATNAGSTAKVAQAVGEELGRNGAQVEVRQVDEVTTVGNYDAVVVGAPMIMGWHRSAVKFVKKHRQGLSQVRVAYFLTALSLTQIDHHNQVETSRGDRKGHTKWDTILPKWDTNGHQNGVPRRYSQAFGQQRGLHAVFGG